MAGGPMVNIAIAFFLFWGVFATVGQVVDAKAEPVVAEVVPCIVPADEDGRACTAEELENNPSPAAAAGLEPGDRVRQLQRHPGDRLGRRCSRPSVTTATARATIVVERDGEQVDARGHDAGEPRPIDACLAEELTPVGFLGVMPVATPIYETGGPVYTVQQMGDMTVDTVQAARPAAGQGVGRRARRSSASRSATPTARSASSVAAVSPVRSPRTRPSRCRTRSSPW